MKNDKTPISFFPLSVDRDKYAKHIAQKVTFVFKGGLEHIGFHEVGMQALHDFSYRGEPRSFSNRDLAMYRGSHHITERDVEKYSQKVPLTVVFQDGKCKVAPVTFYVLKARIRWSRFVSALNRFFHLK